MPDAIGNTSQIVPTQLRDSIAEGGCVLFLGAGSTREAGGPTGKELAALLADHFKKPDILVSDLRQFADQLENLPDVHREDVDSKIVGVLRTLTPKPAHRAVPKFCWKGIFTTNYDRIIEHAYETAHSATGEYPLQDLKAVVSSRPALPISDPTQVGLYKLHGSIDGIDRGTPLVLTSKDYLATKKNRRSMLRHLKALATNHTILFLGYSFGDGIVLSMLDELEEESPYSSRRRMYLLDPFLTTSAAAAFRARNIEPLRGGMESFFSELENYTTTEHRKQALAARIRPITDSTGSIVPIPPRLSVSLTSQMEVLDPTSFPEDGRRFLSGLPPTAGDLRNRNDIERFQLEALIRNVSNHLDSEAYIRPLVVVLGPGGSGKSTIAMRAAYDLAAEGKAVAVKLRAQELWRRRDLVDFAVRINCPSIFVVDDLEVTATYRALRDLRNELSSARARTLLLTSCQKAVWNGLAATYEQRDAISLDLEDVLSQNEAGALVDQLAAHKLLERPTPKQKEGHVRHIIDECEGHLVVAMLELVREGRFTEIVLGEYENLSDRAKDAYLFVALLHQHGVSTPDYILNAVTVNDWQAFTHEIIRQESELIIVQDLNYAAGRIAFRTRHPQIARTIVDVALPQHEDRIRRYRKLIKALATAEEDRLFLLGLLTSRSIREDVREEKYVSEFFEIALDLFPDDRSFILHLGKFETRIGNLERAKEILEWGRKLDLRDSYILHQLGVCYERIADKESRETIGTSKYQGALMCYREKQVLDPSSHYGYASEARMHIKRARREPSKDQRMLMLAQADDAIRQGLSLARESSQGAILECKASLADALGDRATVVAELQQLRKAGTLQYAGTYQLLASSLFELGYADEGSAVIEEGLGVYPGDIGLTGLLLERLESRIYDPEVRRRCSALLADERIRRERETQARFLQAVAEHYESQFQRSREEFRQLRERLRRTAPTKIRISLCDESGRTREVRMMIARASAGRLMATDMETGNPMPVGNARKWEDLGRPRGAFCEVGFSLAGPRCIVVSKWDPAE